jgi:chromosome partitioning protein
LFETVQLVSKRLNPELRITGVVVCLYETSTRLSAEVLADLEEFLTASKSRSIETPWSKADIFSSKIRRNIKLAEAASFGKSVFDYDAACHGAKDYAALAAEVVGAAATLRRPTVRQSA